MFYRLRDHLNLFPQSRWIETRIINRTLSKRSLMHEKERVCPKLDPWGTPVLIAHSEDEFLYKLIRSLCHYEITKYVKTTFKNMSQNLSWWRRPTCLTFLKAFNPFLEKIFETQILLGVFRELIKNRLKPLTILDV